MWTLMQTNDTGNWTEAGNYDSLPAAVKKIQEAEGIPVTGIFLQMYVDAAHGSDQESLSSFEYKGKKSLYVIKRRPLI